MCVCLSVCMRACECVCVADGWGVFSIVTVERYPLLDIEQILFFFYKPQIYSSVTSGLKYFSLFKVHDVNKIITLFHEAIIVKRQRL